MAHINPLSTILLTGSLLLLTRYVSDTLTASHNLIFTPQALQQDFNTVFQSVKNSNSKLPWDIPPKMPGASKVIHETLFGYKYLVIALDEAHVFRNNGAKHAAALALLILAALRLILTATPLQTSTTVRSISLSLMKLR